MATWYEVTCVVADSRSAPPANLTHVGGGTPRGRGWRLAIDEAIEGILEGRWQFFVSLGRTRHTLVVGMTKSGFKYLRGENDALDATILSTLPECKP